MLIVKPYGRSETVRDGEGNLRRQRRLKPRLSDTVNDSPDDIASSRDVVLNSSWQQISVVDKIATKPEAAADLQLGSAVCVKSSAGLPSTRS